jgi:ABC-type cobalamin/Fe3+-siderophores transport system ATPase subunit
MTLLKLAIVGRTGSGKSSLMLSILRGLETSGEIVYDNISASSVNLYSWRSKITVIPQAVSHYGTNLRLCLIFTPRFSRNCYAERFGRTSTFLRSMMMLISMLPCKPQGWHKSGQTPTRLESL